MSFPNTFPAQAIDALGGLLLGKSSTKEQIALAAYDLLGYGLFTWLGDIHYAQIPVGAAPLPTDLTLPVDSRFGDWVKNMSDELKLKLLNLLIEKFFNSIKKA
jgi:hypothetical protein